MRDRNSKWRLPVLAFTGAVLVGLYFVDLNHTMRLKDAQLQRQELLAEVASSIERRFAHTLSSTYILAQEVMRTGTGIENFDEFAQSILDQLDGISNLQLAPDGVVRQIHPLAGNEMALGHDILKDDRRKNDAHLAVEDRRLTLAGPFELVQGGVAVIARNPVFVSEGDGMADGNGRFWGFASALIMLDDLLESSIFESLLDQGYGYRIGHFDSYRNTDVVFANAGRLEETSTDSIDITVPNGVWKLSIGTAAAVGVIPAAIEFAVVLMLAFLLAACCRQIRPERSAARRRRDESAPSEPVAELR